MKRFFPPSIESPKVGVPAPPPGTGIIQTFGFPGPGAGVDHGAIVIPSGVLWRPIALSTVLNASVNAANRNFTIQFTGQNSAYVYAQVSSDFNHTAGLAVRYSVFRGATAMRTGAGSVPSQQNIPMPDTLLSVGERIQVVTGNIDAADQYGSLVLRVEEWSVPY